VDVKMFFFFYVTEVHKCKCLETYLGKYLDLKGVVQVGCYINKEFSDLYSSLNIYGMMKCRRLRRPNVGETRHVCTREM